MNIGIFLDYLKNDELLAPLVHEEARDQIVDKALPIIWYISLLVYLSFNVHCCKALTEGVSRIQCWNDERIFFHVHTAGIFIFIFQNLFCYKSGLAR